MPKDLQSLDHILIFCPNWIGDVIMATPTFRTVRSGWTGARISIALRSGLKPLIEGADYYDELIEFERDKGMAVLDVARALRRRRPDISLLLTHSFRTALLAFLAGSKRRIGYRANGRRFLLTEPLPFSPTPEYMGDQYMRLAARLGCQEETGPPSLPVDRHSEELADEMVLTRKSRRSGPIVGIAPGAAFGPSKIWPLDRYAAVANRLVQEDGASVVVLAGPWEQSIRETVEAGIEDKGAVVKAGETTLGFAKSLMKRLDLLIGADSGARHMAIAFAVPTVIIMGPNDPKLTESRFEEGVVVRAEVDCSPCRKKVCPTDHRCMTEIGVERVYEEARKVLGRVSGGGD